MFQRSGITEAIVLAYESSCPLINPKPLYRNSVWNDDLADKRKKLRKAWNRAGRKGKNQQENKNAYRELLKEYKQAHEKLKERCKKRFFEEANSIPAYARIHKILDPSAQVGSLRKPDGTFTKDSMETAEHLLETHFPGSVPTDLSESVRLCGIPFRKDWKFAEKLTTKGKIKWAVHKFYS